MIELNTYLSIFRIIFEEISLFFALIGKTKRL